MMKWTLIPCLLAFTYSSAWNLIERIYDFCVPMTFLFALLLGYATVAGVELANDA